MFPWKHYLESNSRLPCLIISQTIVRMNLNINLNQSTSSLRIWFRIIWVYWKTSNQYQPIQLKSLFHRGVLHQFYNQVGSTASHEQLHPNFCKDIIGGKVRTAPLDMSHSYSEIVGLSLYHPGPSLKSFAETLKNSLNYLDVQFFFGSQSLYLSQSRALPR